MKKRSSRTFKPWPDRAGPNLFDLAVSRTKRKLEDRGVRVHGLLVEAIAMFVFDVVSESLEPERRSFFLAWITGAPKHPMDRDQAEMWLDEADSAFSPTEMAAMARALDEAEALGDAELASAARKAMKFLQPRTQP